MKILIVEDEPLVAEELQEMLEQLQYRVTAIADSCDDALEKADAQRPDLALLDIELKGDLTGIDLAERLARRGIPYIFITNRQDFQTYTDARNTKPLKNLPKPVTLLSLRNALWEIDLSKAPAGTQIHHFINKSGNRERIDPSDIIYVKSAHNYCDVYFVDGRRAIPSMPLGDFVEDLNWPDVIRISRFHAINLKHIEFLQGNEVKMKGIDEPIRITESFREAIYSRLKIY